MANIDTSPTTSGANAIVAGKEQAPTTFLSLSGELRNQIYVYRVLFRMANGDRRELTIREFRLRARTLVSLLLANRQVSQEVQAMLLGDNIIHLVALKIQSPEKKSALFSTVRPNGNVEQYSFLELSKAAERLEFYTCCLRIELPAASLRPLFKRLNITLAIRATNNFLLVHMKGRLDFGRIRNGTGCIPYAS